MINLRPITTDNFIQTTLLDPNTCNNDFCDPVLWSLAEAWVQRDFMHPLAIYKNNLMVGFVQLYLKRNEFQIINFIIDFKHQGMGFGKQAAQQIIELFKSHDKKATISLPVHPENSIAIAFWKQLGFKLTSDEEAGYLYMRLFSV